MALAWWEIHLTGQPVIDLQKAINSYYGYNKVVVDGYFGMKTQEACPTIKRGDTYKIVGEVQKRLKAKGWYFGEIDCIFGARTQQAMIEYQWYWDDPGSGVCTSIWYHKLYEKLG